MAKKKVGGGNDRSSGGEVLRSRTTTKDGAKVDEKAKGKKPMVEGNLIIKDDGTHKGDGNEKGKRVSGDRDWILKPHNPREENRKISEKGKGKRELVVEEENGEKRRRPNKEIAVPNTSSAERGAYNLRKRKSVPSFQRLGLSESGFALVLGKRVKVYKSSSREWVTGKINSYNDKMKLHKILYVDGKSEELDLKSQRFEVEVMPGEASTLCTKHKPKENIKSQNTKKTNSDGRSDDRTVERGKNGERLVSQEKTAAKPGKKMTTTAGNKKAGDIASAAKSKPMQEPNKDEGQVIVEKRKNLSRKQLSKSNTKK